MRNWQLYQSFTDINKKLWTKLEMARRRNQIPSTSETNLYFANIMLIAFCVQPPAIFLHSGGKFPGCCRGLEVEGQGSEVEGWGSQVEGRASQVEGRKSRVKSRGFHVEGHSLRARKSISRVKSKGTEYKGLYVFYRSKERNIDAFAM